TSPVERFIVLVGGCCVVLPVMPVVWLSPIRAGPEPASFAALPVLQGPASAALLLRIRTEQQANIVRLVFMCFLPCRCISCAMTCQPMRGSQVPGGGGIRERINLAACFVERGSR